MGKFHSKSLQDMTVFLYSVYFLPSSKPDLELEFLIGLRGDSIQQQPGPIIGFIIHKFHLLYESDTAPCQESGRNP